MASSTLVTNIVSTDTQARVESVNCLRFRFALQAVIHFTSFHYVTYVRRPDGEWEMHNNLHSDIETVPELESEIVNPHAVIYIKI